MKTESKVGREIIVNGKHVGKVIAEPIIGFYSDAYLVLLNEEGIRLYRGWDISRSSYATSIRRKLCGKYGDNPNNRFYFFNKNFYSYNYNFAIFTKILTNE